VPGTSGGTELLVSTKAPAVAVDSISCLRRRCCGGRIGLVEPHVQRAGGGQSTLLAHRALAGTVTTACDMAPARTMLVTGPNRGDRPQIQAAQNPVEFHGTKPAGQRAVVKPAVSVRLVGVRTG